MRRRVVVTGAGCVTPLGAEIDGFWQQLIAGHSGIGLLTLFDATNYPVRIAAEVHDWDISDVGEDPMRWQHHPRQTTFAVASALKAVSSARLSQSSPDPARFGIYLGCGETYQNFFQFAELINCALEGNNFHRNKFTASALHVWRPEEAELELNMPASHLAAMLGAQGPNLNCVAACASSTQAVGESVEIIRRGNADVMLAGGAHSMIHPFGITGFQRLAALSTRNDHPAGAVRPFDRHRDGFVVGEGGAMVVLEELEHARGRGAEIWAEIGGFGSAQDAYRITDSHPEGRGAASSMRLALSDACLNPEDIDYINAHGTGTVMNDKIETLAIKRVFGTQAYQIPISSTKSMLGHFTTAGGAVELVISMMAVRSGIIPPTINYETPDPDCDLDYVPNTAREVPCRHVLSNSFGFGGQNAAIIISRYDEAATAPAAKRLAA